MTEKQQIIKRLLEMQKRFIAHEHAEGFSPDAYYHPQDGDPLAGYRDEYDALANKLIDIAHQEKGSKR